MLPSGVGLLGGCYPLGLDYWVDATLWDWTAGQMLPSRIRLLGGCYPLGLDCWVDTTLWDWPAGWMLPSGVGLLGGCYPLGLACWVDATIWSWTAGWMLPSGIGLLGGCYPLGLECWVDATLWGWTARDVSLWDWLLGGCYTLGLTVQQQKHITDFERLPGSVFFFFAFTYCDVIYFTLWHKKIRSCDVRCMNSYTEISHHVLFVFHVSNIVKYEKIDRIRCLKELTPGAQLYSLSYVDIWWKLHAKAI